MTSIAEELGAKPPGEVIDYLNLLEYGEWGAGKTWFAGTAADSPHTSPVLYLDIEGGVTTIRHRKNIDVVRVTSMEQLVKIHRKLYEKQDDLEHKTCVVDSLSELQQLDMFEIMKDAANRNPNQDEDVASPREWGKTLMHMRKVVRAFRDLPMNTIFIAGASLDKNANNQTVYNPNIPGRMRSELPGFVDIVGFLYTWTDGAGDDKRVRRRMQFAKTPTVTAKDRTAALGDFVDDPTVPMLWDLIHNNVTNKEKK